MPARRIVLASEPLLRARYGSGAARVLQQLQPIATAGLVRSGATSAPALRADLQKALVAAPDAAVLLVGGARTLPAFELTPNPAHDDDPEVASDNPYGVPGEAVGPGQVGLPPRAVGRIPDHPEDSAETFAARIGRLCAVRPQDPDPVRSFFLSTESWTRTSQAIAAGLGFSSNVAFSPPLDANAFGEAASPVQAPVSQYLFNLHGSDREAPWYGEDAACLSYPEALTPEAVAALAPEKIAASVVFSQACYGAFLLMPSGPRSPEQANALRFLELGAAAFVGSTSIAYGGVHGELLDSDVLAIEFFKAAFAGMPLGVALQHAREAVLRGSPRPLPGTALKTVLQFVLYGDPCARIAPSPTSASKASARATASIAAEDLDPAIWIPAPDEKRIALAGREGWAVARRFSAVTKSGVRAERTISTRVLQHGSSAGRRSKRPPTPVRYHQEVIEYDAARFEAQSTGGRAVATIQEQEAGVAPWWRTASAEQASALSAATPEPVPPAAIPAGKNLTPRVATGQLAAGSGTRTIADVYRAVEHSCLDAIAWYQRGKDRLALASKWLRGMAIVTIGAGGLVPILVSLQAVKDVLPSELGYVLIGLGAVLLSFDRWFGVSPSYLRYMTTALALQRALDEFRFDWSELASRADGVTAATSTEPFYARARAFLKTVQDLVERETQAWVADFQARMADLERMAKAQGDQARPGTISVQIANAAQAQGDIEVLIDGTSRARVRGGGCELSPVFPGERTVVARGRVGNADASASAVVVVQPGATATAVLTLVPETASAAKNP